MLEKKRMPLPLAVAHTAVTILALHTPGPIGAAMPAGELLKELVGTASTGPGANLSLTPSTAPPCAIIFTSPAHRAGWHYQKVCELGLAGAQQWLKEHIKTEYRPSYTVDWKINVESPGWRFKGKMPASILTSDNQSHARHDFELTFEPTSSSAEELHAVLTAKLSYNENNQVREVVRRIRLQATPGESGVRITVRDRRTGKPLNGVRVDLSGPRNTTANTVDGVAAIDGLPAGKYRITTKHPNYQPVSAKGMIKPGKTSTGMIKLTPKANAGLEVKVLDSGDRHTISGAVVKIEGETAATATTVDGWAKFVKLQAGIHQIEISADGYRSVAGRRDIAAGDTVRGKVLLQPIVDAQTQQPKAKEKKEPDQAPQKDPNACYEPIAKRIAELRAVKQSQNWQSGNVSVRTLDRDGQCVAGWNRCLQQAKKAFNACPPNARGTYENCQQANARAWVNCANQELNCEEKKARQGCGM